MQIYLEGGRRYRLPGGLSDFQREMYIHLINWKWAHLTTEPGEFKTCEYDAILPEEFKSGLDPLYGPIKLRFREHQRNYHFKSHEFLGHMASSQAACANLFLPILQDPVLAAEVLRAVKPDLDHIAVDYLDQGYHIEFWDEPYNLLNDHTPAAGTDADIAIAYYDHNGALSLWMIEHKLTEKEFTTCGGARSKGRSARHSCQPASSVMDDNRLCYYHSGCGYKYWDLTLHPDAPIDLDRIRDYLVCPFKGGMNQLWRNILLAYGLESARSPEYPFKKVYFSVVHHPGNQALNPSIDEFQSILKSPHRFSSFTSDRLVNQARRLGDGQLDVWAAWVGGLYNL